MTLTTESKYKGVLKTGNERLHFNGKETEYKLIDFWRWSVSDILSNTTRGRFAEFIVATALGVDFNIPRDEWQPYDLKIPQKIKIEVKSASYVQNWHQDKLSKIMFTTKATRYWDREKNKMAKTPQRQADVYVFCLLKHLDKSTIDPLNLDQWEFYVLSRKELDDYKRSKVSITLNPLQKLSSPIKYNHIKETVIAKHKLNA